MRVLRLVPARVGSRDLSQGNLAVVGGIPLRGPMAVNHLRQENELTHTVESRYS
jgi:hypothetical protein